MSESLTSVGEYLPAFGFAIIASYLDENDDRSVVEMIRNYGKSVAYQYTIGDITLINNVVHGIRSNPTVIKYYNCRLYYTAWTNSEGLLHRQDGPAIIVYSAGYKPVYEIHVLNGYIENSDTTKPSIINHAYNTHFYCAKRRISIDYLNRENKSAGYSPIVLHRQDGPAEIIHYPNGAVWSITYYQNGFKNNLLVDQPSVIKYHPNGNVQSKMWYEIPGRLSRSGGLPSIQEFDSNNNLIKEDYHSGRFPHGVFNF